MKTTLDAFLWEISIFEISDLTNPFWTRIHRITNLSDAKMGRHRIHDPAHSFEQISQFSLALILPTSIEIRRKIDEIQARYK